MSKPTRIALGATVAVLLLQTSVAFGAAAPVALAGVDRMLDPAAMRAAALAAEAAKNPAAALEAWERVIDRCDSTEEQRTEARTHIHTLRPLVPRNTDLAAAKPWTALVILFRSLEFSWKNAKGEPLSIKTVMTAEDEKKVRDSIRSFGDHVLRLSSGLLRIDAEVAVIEAPLTKLSGEGKAYWAAPWNIRDVTDRLMKDKKYDSVFVYVKFTDGRLSVPAPHMGGTFGGDVGPHGAGWTDVPWHPGFPADGEMELHEWLHQVDWMFSAVLYYPNEVVPSSDEGRKEGDDSRGGDPEYRRRKDERTWMRFYQHIMEEHITRQMWKEATMHDPPLTPWADRWLHRWLVLGPFRDQPGKPAAASDLIGEQTVRPREGDKVAGRSWTALPATPVRVDLLQAAGAASNAAAYLATYVHSRQARPARLLLGSDDGARAWVNGELVIDKLGGRPLKIDDDQAPVNLKAGWNLILIKVQQIGGGWLAQARLTDADGKTMWNLVQSPAPEPAMP